MEHVTAKMRGLTCEPVAIPWPNEKPEGALRDPHPLCRAKAGERPVVVVLVADPLQIAGLVTLAGAILEGADPVRVPPMAACQQIGVSCTRRHAGSLLGLCSGTRTSRPANGWVRPSRRTCSPSQSFRLFQEMGGEAKDSVFDGPACLGLAGGSRE
jgi:hypothetical protein